ncbi:MAG: membrane dipeptidase [Anaerolineales bacterium]|nr:membrane dipeptidase [Anaerolineales bacterium]
MIIVDAHQDLAWNIATFGRDYSRSVSETRAGEKNSIAPLHNGDTLIGYPEYQLGKIAIVFSTLFAAPARKKVGDWASQCYTDPRHAKHIYTNQLDIYKRMCEEHPEKFRLISSKYQLSSLLTDWNDIARTSHPVGLVLLMEGAEAIAHPEELAEWRQAGVQIIGPAWAGTRFCGGTGEPGPMTKEGFALLEAMAEFGFTLDLSHMDEKAALQALDVYPGTIIASHANAKALLPGSESNRFLSDRLIMGLLERDGLIGVVPYNSFLKNGWKQGDSRAEVPLEYLVNHIDYICQKAGNADQAGIGSDFDGGFGVQSTPEGIDTVADLRKIIPLLAQKGYTEKDITKIMGGNWVSYLENNLTEAA